VAHLEHNRLTCIPSFTLSLSHLTYLTLGNNRITEIPEAFGALTSLKGLDLSFNYLKVVRVLGKLQKIEELRLQGNPDLPDYFARNSVGSELVDSIRSEYALRWEKCRSALLAFCLLRCREGHIRDLSKDVFILIVNRIWCSKDEAAWGRHQPPKDYVIWGNPSGMY
jgi:hypothetical protein